ncbi:tetratricopeptide repeat protein [Nannocystis pusilla]|uniref:tetratricopeptide repeat protein n=1 Tax=Nannocystis pusilla TaxID=889268 RepID=UPI003B82FAD6
MALWQLSEAYRLEGRHDRLLAIDQELLDIYDADPTRKGFDVPGLLTNIGETLCLLDRCSEALEYFTRLMRLYRTETPPEPALQAIPLRGIGLAHLRDGKPDLALPFLEQALKFSNSLRTNAAACPRTWAPPCATWPTPSRRSDESPDESASSAAAPTNSSRRSDLSAGARAARAARAPPIPAPRG